jgi:predicted DNA-binding protein with PD1-like motif
MEYRRFNDTIIARIDRGEDIVEKVKEIALKENIRLANVNALGAVGHITVGLYKVAEKRYYANEFDGEMEIVSLTGSINTMDGEFYSHLHIACADQSGSVVGGHLNKAIVSATCEMFIKVIDGTVDRYKDEVTGLNLFKF